MVARGQWIVKLEKLRQCKKCNSYFLDQTNYEKHKEFHLIENKVSILPEETFPSSEDVKIATEDEKDSSKTDDKKNTTCSTCGRNFSQRGTLLRHIKTIHEHSMEFKCEFCQREFGLKQGLKIHIQNKHFEKDDELVKYKQGKLKGNEYTIIIEGDIKKYKCSRCENVFEKNQSFYHHFYITHKAMPFKCDKCNKTFTQKSIHRQHSEKCDGILRIKKSRKNYQIIRNKIKDVEYKEIDNSNGEKEFQCNKCEKTYGTVKNMLQHIYKVHREKKLKCEKCSKMFALKSMLDIHVKRCQRSEGR